MQVKIKSIDLLIKGLLIGINIGVDKKKKKSVTRMFAIYSGMVLMAVKQVKVFGTRVRIEVNRRLCL